MDNQPLLSICIPTYNRARFLDKAVRTMLALPAFDDAVEIAISDNASTDNTESTVNKIISDYPQKNIIYHRNFENTRDKNFCTALTVATGKYRKLQNDVIYFGEEDLAHIKEVVRNSPYHEGQSLFFYMSFLGKKSNINSVKHVHSVDEFISTVHNKITWISNFGCYAEQVPLLNDMCMDSNMQLLQMQWALSFVQSSSTTDIYSINTYQEVAFEDAKKSISSYNFFTPHVENYYKILRSYHLRLCTILKDKDCQLKDFVGKRFMYLVLLGQNKDYNLKGSWSIMFRHFWMIPRFYYIITLKFMFKWTQFKLTGKVR